MAKPVGSSDSGIKVNWMPAPQQVIPDCPPGLEYLLQIDRFIVSLSANSWGRGSYRVRNTEGQDIYSVVRTTQCSCTTPEVPLILLDGYQRQVAHFVFNDTGCLFKSYNNMSIEAPPGSCIGGVKSDHSFSFQHWFSVMNSDSQTVLKITKSAGQFFSSEVDFKILSADTTQEVGVITRKWFGFAKSLFNAEAQHTFAITFPMDLDVKMKAVMVLAAIIIDGIYFTSSSND